jgi:hypothetical protein
MHLADQDQCDIHCMKAQKTVELADRGGAIARITRRGTHTSRCGAPGER